MLLVPLDRLMGVPERMAQRLFSELKCSGESQIVEGNSLKRALEENSKGLDSRKQELQTISPVSRRKVVYLVINPSLGVEANPV